MNIVDASLSAETKKRYLSYALSVITARALPDVRDGLKPVQRRILYTMQHDLRLRPDGRYVKSARVVGDVMGKYHPHGNDAIYDALARLAQDFTMRVPLIAGQGNFGSPDDPPAAMRYTECKLANVATELLRELPQRTVPYRPNYDGQLSEPTVLPARFPHLLVNGCQGIAVGMATSIPTHNLGEVLDACSALIDDPSLDTRGVMKYIKGPDFPSGGQIVSSRKDLAATYEAGHGSMKLRGEWKEEAARGKGSPTIVVKSVPYGVGTAALCGKIGEVIAGRKLPVLLNVSDESTDAEGTRIVLETKKGADPRLVMAYLYKHTPLQTNVQLNLTCLVPTAADDEEEGELAGEALSPRRVGLVACLRHFLDFRMQVVLRRLRYDLEQIEKRIHILEGLVLIFDALDEAIRIIRRSDGKADAAQKLEKRFGLSDVQADAILELKLYRLAKLEMQAIRKELDQRRKEAASIRRLLGSEKLRWKLIKRELDELRDTYGDRRRTKISGATNEPAYDAEAFIVDEDQVVLLSQQGWLKRQGRVSDLSATRVRDGDGIQSVTAGSTRASVAFFSALGSCYVSRIVDVPATSGYGNPVQTLFKMGDGERIVEMMGFDPRVLDVPASEEEPQLPFAVAISKSGMATRFSLRTHRDPSSRAGRKFMRLGAEDEVVAVQLAPEGAKLFCVSVKGCVLVTRVDEIPLLGGPGKGVRLIKLAPGDEVLAARVMTDSRHPLVVENEKGKAFHIDVRRAAVARGGKGTPLFKRGRLAGVRPAALEVPELNGAD